MAESDFDYHELDAFGKRALQYMESNYPKLSEKAMRKAGQTVVRQTKKSLLEHNVPRKSKLYKSIKRTGTWQSGNTWAVRQYVSSSLKDENGKSARDYAYPLEHGWIIPRKKYKRKSRAGKVRPKRYMSWAIQEMDDEIEKTLTDFVDDLIDKGVGFGG